MQHDGASALLGSIVETTKEGGDPDKDRVCQFPKSFIAGTALSVISAALSLPLTTIKSAVSFTASAAGILISSADCFIYQAHVYYHKKVKVEGKLVYNTYKTITF